MTIAAPAFALFSTRSAAAIFCVFSLSGLGHAATITVDNSQDSNSAFVSVCSSAPNDCSFWGALLAANVTAEVDTIAFDLPINDDPGCSPATGVCRLHTPNVALNVTHPVIIDGYTQPGATANTLANTGQGVDMNLKIELFRSAGNAQNTVQFLRGATLRGLALARDPLQQSNQFGPMFGFYPTDGDYSAIVEGNILGAAADGSLATNAPFIKFFRFGDCPQWVQFPSALHVRVGGLLAAQRNWFVAGDPAITVSSCQFNNPNLNVDTLIQGNLFGTAKSGIGTPGVPGSITAYDWIKLNISGDPPVMIGGTDPLARNVFVRTVTQVISSTSGTTGPTHIKVLGNYFGLAVDGLTPLLPSTTQNMGGPMIDLWRAQIGGMAEGERNFFVANHVNALILGNAPINAMSNVFIGNRAYFMVNSNRGGAPTNFIDSPQISAFTVAGSNVNLTYKVSTLASQAVYPLTVEFYRASNDNNAEILLGRDTYTAAEATQNKSISLPIPPGVSLNSEDVVIAAASAANDKGTGEFSWYPVQINFFGNAPVYVNVPNAFTVRVQGLGPFRPSGTVRIGNGPLGNGGVQICTATLTPSAAGPFIAEATCNLSVSQPGPRTFYAAYDHWFENFRSESGQEPTTERSVTVVTAPVDNLFCDGFESPFQCAGRP